ncbi:MAG: ribonuclease E activity regulator RraA [Gammaproteobacteria bacterium]|nr:ribonuclease E activity regulator RraA [Gammaproteobacteria bacterium]NIO26653.1 ribonuclease E activity regulator RraA [Gammaproteobacteria bacterium]NIO67206.1 ribonuclease E activity regulator RraA [Gammaproteobacteria bacterium]NIP47257.1 ribonuclease E activity regulator RraA [Gammaproteobacteria bacterium]NIP66360.1 ribonuclease E activity regulator RraA [Gammaproteobacteria bacterium]
MASGTGIIRTADICDDFGDEVLVCELAFADFAARDHFHGEAVTFATYEDNQGIRELLAEGGAGKVLVVDGRGSLRRALCGGNIAALAHQHGWQGLIFNGAIRDSHEFADLDFGVKAIGTTAMAPRKDGIGRRGVEIYIGNITIHPGDYVYADRDAVIVSTRPVHDL